MTCPRLLPLLLSLAISLFWLSQAASAAVLAIDYGSEWIKASLMKPGVPFDVLLNRDSKRKIMSSVAWKGDDRLFGSDAFNIATRVPADSFSFLKSVQGAPFESDAVANFRAVSPVELVRTRRGTVGVRRPDANGTEWSAEELIAMQFAYVKGLAEAVGAPDAREPVRDAVVAVPPYFTQFERDAVADALEIAGLRLLALVNDGTAVALNYALARSFAPEREWHVVYDAGASGVRATVVSFAAAAAAPPAEGKAAGRDSTQITVAGVGYDRTAGGLEVDRRLRDMLALDFEVKHKRAITGDARGMAKLWKEAARVKTVLSANTEASATVESVAFDVDYRAKVTRAALETACADMKPKFAQPIVDALANAGLALDDVASVILTGGHSRVPMVQAAVRAAVGEGKIATSVNADEAAVLGAALYGASISRQFRTKDIRVSDIVPYDIQVSYQSEPKISDIDAEGAQVPLKAPKTINTVVFPAGSKAGSKKTLTFKRKDDFVLRMGYKASVEAGFPTELLQAEISGVKEALAELVEAGAVDPVVKATVVLSESGFAGIQDAVAYGEIKKDDESFAGKLKGFFGGAKEEAHDEPSSSSSSSGTSSSSSSTSSASSGSEDKSSASSSPSASPVPEKKKEIKDTIPLQLEVKPLSIPALTPKEVRRSRDRLIAIETAEAVKRRREEARNGLEAYLYRLRDLLEDSDDANPFKKCSKEQERDDIREKVYETLQWMSEEADEAQLIDFWDKKDVVERLERPIQLRYKEIEAFPSTLNSSQRINWSTRVFITEARKNLTAELVPGNLPAKYTEDEVDALEKTLREHEAWLNEWVERQKSVQLNEDPVILTTEMKARAKTLENALLKLLRRKAPPKAKKSASSASAATSSTSSSSVPSERASAAGEEARSPGESSTTAGAQSPHDEL
ncbi:actin-like ATPase domain-containing protein [Phellopilus nigrolimitatus]|nr:actin-like ATPase domain-containing protein [Phellopilus nigrolimitatus]